MKTSNSLFLKRKQMLLILTANFFTLTLCAQPPTAFAPVLGKAATFAVFGGGAGITNQGTNTIIHGSIGTTAASTYITGFYDGVNAATYQTTGLNAGNATGGVYTDVPAPGTANTFLYATQALADASTAYNAISPVSQPGGIDPGAGELGGLTLTPGVYKATTFKISNVDLTLDAMGDSNAVFIFQTAAALTVGIPGPIGARSVILTNGALARNVYWFVGSAATINGAGGGTMVGTIIAYSAITFSTAGNAVQTVLNGRALSLNASVTMVNTTVNANNTWTGISNNNWNVATNWSTGAIPIHAEEVLIPAVSTNMPVVSSGAGTLHNLVLYSGSTLNVNGTLEVGGSLTSMGTLTATGGSIHLNGSLPQKIAASVFNTNTIQNLLIDNTAGVSLLGSLNITGTYSPIKGTLLTNGFLTLKSDASATARIANGTSLGGYINGVVNAQRFIPGGSRKYRFLSHAFSTPMALTQITDDIDITGTITGLNANNFTPTTSNAASSFSFNEANDDGVMGSSNNAGWTAFSSSNAASTITQGQGIRVLIRGSKGQAGSLTGGAYTPLPVTIGMTGTLMQGDFVQNLNFTNASKGWNLISNPYASNIDWLSVTRTNINDAIYTYRPSLSAGNYGSYINGSATNGGSQFVEAYSSFFVRANTSSPTLGWHEADKIGSNPTNSTFRTVGINNRLLLTLSNDAGDYADETVLRFGGNPATDGFDTKYDAENIPGTAYDLFVLDKNKLKYSIYHGSQLKTNSSEKREVILGINNVLAGNYILAAKILNSFTNGNTAYLKDSLLNTLTEITDNTAYKFSVPNGETSVSNRFSIVFNAKDKSPLQMVDNMFTVQLSPNPVKDVLNIMYNGIDENQESTISVTDMKGMVLKTITLPKSSSGKQMLAINDLPSGMYIVKLRNNQKNQTQSFIKQ